MSIDQANAKFNLACDVCSTRRMITIRGGFMAKTIFLTRPVVRILIVCGFLLALAGVVWLMSGMPTPREQDRVVAGEAGFSVIKPPEWDSRVMYGAANANVSATIEITPVKSVGLMQRFCTSQFRVPPDEKAISQQFTPRKFQDREAWLFSGWVKRDYMFRLVFERGGRWYEMSLRLPAETDVPNSDWWKYINTFRVHETPSTVPNDQAPMTKPQ
jgi:hypothetical protein